MTTVNAMIMTAVLVYTLCVWLGCYLLARQSPREALSYTGAGLLAYAASLAAVTLAAAPPFEALASMGEILALLPPLLWAAAARDLLPPGRSWRQILSALIIAATALIVLIASILSPALNLALLTDLARAAALVPLIVAVVLMALYSSGQPTVKPFRVPVLVVMVFFGLSLGAYLFPLGIVSPQVALLLVGLDLALLGVLIAAFDAFDEGQTLLPDLLSSLVSSLALAAVFGGQVALALMLGAGRAAVLVALLFGVITTAVVVNVFAAHLQRLLDGVILRRAQADETDTLRQAASAVRRSKPAVDFHTMPVEEFQRLTRRAISHMGSLPKLVASPLMHLTVLEEHSSSLERAAELRALLVESIERLRPHSAEGFNSTDEWRHFNALYYPYVKGIRPYSRRALHDDLDDETQAALDWFQQQVPERTLYNWQSAASELVARDLLERIGRGWQ